MLQTEFWPRYMVNMLSASWTLDRDSVGAMMPDKKLWRLFGLLGEFARKGQDMGFTSMREKDEELFGSLVQRWHRVALLHC